MKTCPCFRTIIAGIAYAIIAYIVGRLVWGGIFGAETAAHAQLWRDMSLPLTKYGMPVGQLIIGLGLAHAYRRFYPALCGSGIMKGMCFGTTLWFAFGLGFGIFWYALSPVSEKLLIASLVNSAASLIIGSGAIALVFGKLLDQKKNVKPNNKKKAK